jgi:hypothetical protein
MRDIDDGLRFHPLTTVVEGEDVVIGRADTDTYGVFPVEGAALLDRLRDGLSPAEAADWYEREYAEPVDMADFLETLTELGFLASQGEPVDGTPRGTVRFRAVGRALFSPPALVGYAALTVVCAWLMIRMPELRPRAENVFFSHSLLLVQFAVFVGGTIGIGVHESFHVLAGRRLGLPSRLGVSRRLYFLVFETTLVGLRGVPKAKRYLPFAAGMLADVVVFCALTVGAALTVRSGIVPWHGQLALGMAYLTMVRFAWQFYFFLRTDLYYLIAAALGCHDLHEAAKGLLRNRIARLRGRPGAVDDTQWSAADRRHARWYAPVMVTGFVVLTAVFLLALLPVLTLFLLRVVDGLLGGSLGLGFWDTLIATVSAFLPSAVAGLLALRERLTHRVGRPTAAPTTVQ